MKSVSVPEDYKNQIIPVHIIDIKEEIRILKNQIAALLQEKTELEEYICPRLQRAYFDAFGEYGVKIQALEIKIRELKYRIRLLQAALNRKQAVACSYVDAQVKQAYQDYYDKAAKEKQRQQEEWEKQQDQEKQRKNYEQEYNRKQADQGQTADIPNGQNEDRQKEDGYKQKNVNDQDPKNKDGKNTQEADGQDESDGNHQNGNRKDRQNQENGDEAAREKSYQDEFAGMSYKEKLKALYRAIMKKLHPDANPNVTEYQKKLLQKAMEAYSRGDIKTLEEIYDEIINATDLEDIPMDAEGMKKLRQIKENLLKKKNALQEAIRKIKSTFPYTEKAILENPQSILERQILLKERIREYEDIIRSLQAKIQNLQDKLQQMEEKAGNK